MRYFIWAACVSLVVSSGSAFGQLSITSSSNIDPKIRIGSTITYTLNGNPTNGNITDIQWSYQMTSPCQSEWSAVTDTGTTRTMSYAEYTPGTFTVKAHLTVMVGYTPQPLDVTGTFTVLPPDDIKLPVAPNNTQTVPIGTRATFSFPVMCSGEVIGYCPGSPKETLKNVKFFGDDGDDQELIGKAPLLTIQGQSIVDLKSIDSFNDASAPRFDQLAVGATFMSYRQQFYVMILSTYCGLDIRGFTLKTWVTVTISKAGADSVTITVGP